ncbi:MAG: ParB/RepB/Spo0J family partition protein [Spirochaetales bacterium]|nr:ParB/RepB/Spo0J family partition protein [Spirochaetales bacterium]
MSKGLGRGFGALLPDEDSPTVLDQNTADGVKTVALSLIEANPDQPRKDFDPVALEELAASIREKGILQPILVEAFGSSGFRIIAGERRYRAAKLAGLTEVPVLVRSFSAEERMEIALIENVQRSDLNPVEEARAYRQLMESFNLTQEMVAQKVGKQRSTVANALRLLKLSDEMLDDLEKGLFSPGHARTLLAVEDLEKRKLLYQKIRDEGWSVREAEAFVSGKPVAEKSPGPKTSPGANPNKQSGAELASWEQKLIDVFGTKVRIKGDHQKGVVEISYFSLEDLERILGVAQTEWQTSP